MRPFTAMRKVIQHYGERRGCGDDGDLPKRGEHGEACGRVGVAFPRRLLRGRGDRRQEASWAPETVTSIEK